MVAHIRPETAADGDAIRRVLVAAFPSPVEADLVEALRAAGQLLISLVAQRDASLVGHIGFSPVRIETPNDTAVGLGLAPVAVQPQHQRSGIGALLVLAGLQRARELGTRFVVVLGDPRYYQRFGFRAAEQWGIGNAYGAGEEFMALELIPGGIPRPAGMATYAPAFASVA